jgi:hypothetical protein
MRPLLLALLAVAVTGITGGCFIDDLPTDRFIGKRCLSQFDCPSDLYCGAGGTCEPELTLAKPDSGFTGEPFYCKDVKVVLDRTCLYNCHGVIRADSLRYDFRLDYYEKPGPGCGPLNDGGLPDGGCPDGAKAVAADIARMTFTFQSMPPPCLTAPGCREFPTQGERRLLDAWVKAGAPWCDDGGTP